MAGPYPLSTLSCTIDSTGISAPSFEDVLESLKASYRLIYGADSYLELDSQDGQWISVIALAISDNNSRMIDVYQSFSPAFAQGAALASRVQLNGITKNPGSKSTVDIQLTGVVGTSVSDAVLEDLAGNKWDLNGPVLIGITGIGSATAIAQQDGQVLAPANTVTKINTPIFGLQSVTNITAANPGSPVESDPALRTRQKKSTAIASQTIIDSIIANLANLPGVSRSEVFENDTDVVDSLDVQAHTIAAVVQGGDLQGIVNVLGLLKSPGIQTQGNLFGFYTNKRGFQTKINFYDLVLKIVTVEITVKALNGYSSGVSDLIKTAVAASLNGLSIGETVYIGKLYGPANLQGRDAVSSTGLSQSDLYDLNETYNVQQIKISVDGDPVALTDIPLSFFEAANGDINAISVILAP